MAAIGQGAIVLIACSGKKHQQRAPARSLYQGRLFKLSVQYAERAGQPWRVLSAKLGLVHPDALIESD